MFNKAFYNQGFSITEMMVVVLIVGILGAVAIPTYRSYIMRTRITEAIHIAGAYKSKIEKYYNITNKLPGCLDNTSVGMGDNGHCDNATTSCSYGVTLNSSSAAYIYVGCLAGGSGVGAQQDLVVRLQPDLWPGQAINARIHLRATITSANRLKWDCRGVSQIPEEYMPGECSQT